ncbi:MAG: D-tyrosyl-tRNA(Tyr) deacylase [Chloroflexi bacterium]|nr:D-tyrosyl-tRNA(Tyr) deacylase [Chloroflexota bacterium]
MRLLLQRVTRAEVRVADALIARIGPGLAVLVGVAVGDDEVKARMLAGKVAELRIFRDAEGRTNRSLLETGGEALVVSQFTLLADTRKGRRPSFLGAASPAEAERLYSVFSDAVLSAGVSVQRGVFRAEMELELVNDGPMTIWLDSDAS